MGPMDIEGDERRERDEMVRRRILPGVDVGIALQLAAIGVVVGGPDAVGSQIERLPPGWRVEADPLNHRAYHVLDEHHMRRVACAWKAGTLFGREPGRGSTSILGPEADDGLVRLWDAEDSERVLRDGKRRVTISCSRCMSADRHGAEFDVFRGRDPAREAELLARAEAHYRARHVCTTPS